MFCQQFTDTVPRSIRPDSTALVKVRCSC